MASHWTWSQIHITTASRALVLSPLLTFQLHLKLFSPSFSVLQWLLTFSPVLKHALSSFRALAHISFSAGPVVPTGFHRLALSPFQVFPEGTTREESPSINWHHNTLFASFLARVLIMHLLRSSF